MVKTVLKVVSLNAGQTRRVGRGRVPQNPNFGLTQFAWRSAFQEMRARLIFEIESFRIGEGGWPGRFFIPANAPDKKIEFRKIKC